MPASRMQHGVPSSFLAIKAGSETAVLIFKNCKILKHNFMQIQIQCEFEIELIVVQNINESHKRFACPSPDYVVLVKNINTVFLRK